ncbi:MAG TPA: hypothetical protein V6C81_12110 [Planktothrix sp.]|jgi:hypothetical protein
MHKQIHGLTDQLGLVNYQLGEVTKLDAEAPKAAPGAPFPLVMSATVVGKSLGKARELLTEAKTLLEGEIGFFTGIDQCLAEHQTIADETAKTAAIEATNKEAGAREATTAGIAAYCMQAVAAASVFMLKGMEKARSYRS